MRRAVWALLLLSYCGCATSRSSESETHAAVTVQQDTSLARNETRTVTQGPETVTTVVEEWAANPPDAPGGSPAGHSVATGPTATARPPSLPQRAALIKRTTVVDVRGPIVAQTALQATAATETHAAATKESEAQARSSSRPTGLLALWPLLPVALAVLGWFKRDLLLGLVKRVLR